MTDEDRALALKIVQHLRYVVLATADEAGRPWSSPVYFAHRGLDEFTWISRPGTTHSRNIAVRPEIGSRRLRLPAVARDRAGLLRPGVGNDHRVPVPSAG